MPAAPAAPAAPPPSAPPAGVTIIDTGPPKPPPAPTSTIRVSDMPKLATPTPDAKPGTAKDRMMSDLRKKAINRDPAQEPKPEVEPAPNRPGAQDTPPESPTEPGESPTDPETVTKPPGEVTTDPKAGTKPPGKTNPWKLVDQYKQRTAELEKQIAEAKTGALVEQERKKYLDQIEQHTKRNAELEDEMRFVNYSKSEEFQTKYQKPYTEAWRRAALELSEIMVMDNGQERQATADDLAALISLPLGKAREVADEAFGRFADDVMAHRKELRGLFAAQQQALEEAKTKGAERAKQQQEMTSKQQQDIIDHTKTYWEKANADAVADPKYGQFFKPLDGDQEGNLRLAKGFEMVDRAMNENPSDPSLTPEARATIVRRHAALRNRAAAFGRVMNWYNQAMEKVTALEKELAGFRSSTPGVGSSSAPRPADGGAPTSAKESVFAALRKLAK